MPYSGILTAGIGLHPSAGICYNPFQGRTVLERNAVIMILKNLLEGLDYTLTAEDGTAIQDPGLVTIKESMEVSGIQNDSRKVKPGDLFFCITGANSDGHAFAGKAADSGADVLVVEHAVSIGRPDVVQVLVPSTRHAMAVISANWYGNPARRMKMIGITGTKGKTTTTYLVKSILEAAGLDVGLIGTIESTYHDVHVPSANTTPESIVLQKTLKDMADAGVQAVVMEVSSQALMQERVGGIQYDIGVFTNISPDHIGPNEHASFEDYMHCKGLLFRQCRVGIVNGDDENTKNVLKGHTCEVETYGLAASNDLYAENFSLIEKPGELGISFDTKGLLSIHAEVPTPGRFSVYNALAAIAICRHFRVPEDDIEYALKQAHVKGRIELVKVSDQFTVMIDYAHNAVALESLLAALKEYRHNRIVTLFGCGGNRSKLRRYEMGEVSGKMSDFTIITSDNPRFEEPLDIIADIETGMKKTDGKYIVIPDRREAIAYAIHHGEPGDIIVLAGKGHEDYQEIKGVKYPMDERVIIQQILEEDQKKA